MWVYSVCMKISMSIPGNSSNLVFSDCKIRLKVLNAAGVCAAILSSCFLSSPESSVMQKPSSEA